jgi:probable HAF family extracellular repeat protein
VFGNVAFGINNKGQVVGQSDLPGDTVHHAFLWEKGVMADLGSLSAALPTSVAGVINNKGQVVGTSQDVNGDDSSSVAWVWQNGVMTDLNELIPANSSLFLMEATSINARGDIAGFGRLSNGEYRGFVLKPCNDGDEGCKNDLVGAATSPSANRRVPAVSANSFGQGRWTPWYRRFIPSH